MFGGHSERLVERVVSAPKTKAPNEEEEKAKAAQKALDEEKEKKGRLSTILTSGQGASGAAPTAKKTLLGQ